MEGLYERMQHFIRWGGELSSASVQERSLFLFDILHWDGKTFLTRRCTFEVMDSELAVPNAKRGHYKSVGLKNRAPLTTMRWNRRLHDQVVVPLYDDAVSNDYNEQVFVSLFSVYLNTVKARFHNFLKTSKKKLRRNILKNVFSAFYSRLLSERSIFNQFSPIIISADVFLRSSLK